MHNGNIIALRGTYEGWFSISFLDLLLPKHRHTDVAINHVLQFIIMQKAELVEPRSLAGVHCPSKRMSEKVKIGRLMGSSRNITSLSLLDSLHDQKNGSN